MNHDDTSGMDYYRAQQERLEQKINPKRQESRLRWLVLSLTLGALSTSAVAIAALLP